MANPPIKTVPPPLKPAANTYHLVFNHSENVNQVNADIPPQRGVPAPNPPVPVPAPPLHFIIQGITSDNAFGNISVPLEITGVGTIITAGSYSFTVSQGFNGTTIPHKSGGAFVPPFRVYTNVQADQLAQNFVFFGTALHISGTVTNSGSGMSGVPIEIVGDGTVISAANGSYGFDVGPGFSGTTIPHNSGGTFAPPSYVYVSLVTDQSNQNFAFTASQTPYDAFTNYGSNAPLSGLNQSNNGLVSSPPAPFTTAYVSGSNLVRIYSTDDMTQYNNGAALSGLNGGGDWSGTYAVDT